MTVYKNTVLRLNLPVMVLLKSAVNLAHIFKVSAYEELKTEIKPQNSWKREREKRKNMYYLYKCNNVENILKGEKTKIHFPDIGSVLCL